MRGEANPVPDRLPHRCEDEVCQNADLPKPSKLVDVADGMPLAFEFRRCVLHNPVANLISFARCGKERAAPAPIGVL